MTQPTKQIWDPHVKHPMVADWVWFYDKGAGDPIAALVTGANKDILSLTVFRVHSYVSMIYSGVRHRDNRWNFERPERALDNGTWAFKGDEVRPFIDAPDEEKPDTKPDEKPDTTAGSRTFKDGRDNKTNKKE